MSKNGKWEVMTLPTLGANDAAREAIRQAVDAALADHWEPFAADNGMLWLRRWKQQDITLNIHNGFGKGRA